MTIHRIKLKDLNKEYLENLKANSRDKDQEITIWIPEKSDALSEKTFWEIIALFDWEQQKGVDIMTSAILFLSELSITQIKSFDDILSEKLYHLDGQQYAENTGQNAFVGKNTPFSVDSFLYARCMAVAKGEETYKQIIANPKQMIKDDSFEPLLSLAQLAYLKKTNQPYEHIPAFIYETFANTKGWDHQDFLSNLLS